MQDFIKPTLGRKIYYIPDVQTRDDGTVHGHDNCMVQYSTISENSTSGKNSMLRPQPFDATIIYVWSDTCVNLRVTDHAGNDFTRTSVSVNAGDGVLPRAEWMDYQKGQAAKTEQLQAELEKKMGGIAEARKGAGY